MGQQLEIFLRDNPDLKKVEDGREGEVLKWADREGYIALRKFAGQLWYSELDYEKAVMWSEKIRGVDYQPPRSEEQ